MTDVFTTVRTVGGLLPPDLLGRVVAGDRSLAGMASSDYRLGGRESTREAANRHWQYLHSVWRDFREALSERPADDPAVGLTRDRWLMLLLGTLGYGRVPPVPAGGLVVDGRAFPLSHLWEQVPLHLLGWGVDLDARTPAVPGAAKQRPHAMVQELLNRSDPHLWAVLSNGRQLRLLRDSTTLSGQSFVEFDLEAMFDGEVFSDFVLLFLLAHQSRLEVRTPDGPPTDCWLETWRTTAAESGTRALELLRVGVQDAIGTLATGFLRHPAGADLNRRLADGDIRLSDYHAEVLRLVYRLLFLFVVEDRGLLHGSDVDTATRHRYASWFSTRRLRELALRRRGDGHPDLWQTLRLVLDGLGRDGGRPELGVPYFGGLYDTSGDEDRSTELLDDLAISNRDLLTAVRQLCVVQPKGQPRRRVDYRNLDAEELGSIYESLLELAPRHDHNLRTVTLELLAGNDRKTSGSYYTPSALIDLVLDEALDPVLDRAWAQLDRQEALLALTVCDPACGSGHFLVAAARRIALRLAKARTGDLDPTPTDVQEAMHDVVSRCIYGVDVTPLALDLAKVSLWLASVRPDRPLAFLDAHLKVGNALLGATPRLVAEGVPDAAFAAVEGDDKKQVAALRKRNKVERQKAADEGAWGLKIDALFGVQLVDHSNRAAREQVALVHAAKLLTREDVRVARQRLRDADLTAEAINQRARADAWCATFVQPKVPGALTLTDDDVRAAADGTLSTDASTAVSTLRDAYRFFHWHLEFPEVFDVPAQLADTPTGWWGGFSAAVGNPPWERVKLQEKEFFASRDPQVTDAPTAAKRTEAIAALAERSPTLHQEFLVTRRHSEGVSHLLRSSGRYPLCGVGDVNTYSVFAEHMRTIIAPEGRMGVITPTGLATDNTTSAFFADTLRAGRLSAFYDFENEAKIFAGVHNQLRFAVTVMTGGARTEQVSLAFYTRHIDDVPSRRFELAPEEVLAVNPNTGTLPAFRTRRDAEIALRVYRRHPVLIRDGEPDGNPWGLSFARLLDMANDSDLFVSAEDARAGGGRFDGWAWQDSQQRLLPLYEAKMLGHYDHRFSTYEGAAQAQLNKGTLPRLDAEQHGDPDLEPLARHWVGEREVDKAIGTRWDRDWLFGWRDITNASNERTMIPSALPRSAVGHVFPVVLPANPSDAALLQAIWSSMTFDYIVRQKLSGTHLTYGVLHQVACPVPSDFGMSSRWEGMPTREWIIPRVLELAYTSHRLAPYARDFGDDGPPFRWDPDRRALIRAELDAAMFHVYGMARDEVEHVLDSFFVVRKYEERDYGEFRTRRLVLAAYDAMVSATPGSPAPTLDPPPGQGPRHPAQPVHVSQEAR